MNLKTPRDSPQRSGWAEVAAVLAVLSLSGAVAEADVSTPGSEFHVRLGLVDGNFNSPNQALANAAFSVANSVDLEYEHFSSARGSYLIRTLFSFDTSTSSMRYMYTGVGKRWYFWGDGMQFNATDGADQVTTAVKRRYYFTAEGGLSTVVGTLHANGIFEALSADYEFGGNFGVIQQMGSSWGIEVQAGYTQAFGFSSVSFSGSTIRMLLGASIYF